MPRIRIFRTASFQRMIGAAAILALSILVMAGFVYWETVGYFTRQMDDSLIADARSFAKDDPATLKARLEKALAADRREGKAYAVFAADGTRVAGNIAALAPGLPEPDRPASLTVTAARGGQDRTDAVRLVTERLADGQTLVLGRTTEALEEITEIITRAMALAIIPALVLSVIGGTVLSRATLRRVEAVHRACRSIMEGHFDRRLPLRDGHDEFDRLAVIVNTMLDEIERLMTEVKGAGDAIAHDLRTPLTRLRARLERSVAAIEGDPPVKAALEKSLGDIDQLLVTVAALMRIAEVEQSRRRENFESVDLGEIVTVLTEFYQPIAEENGLAFFVDRHPTPPVEGDGDLLFEALANLVDNAIKFTPEGGKVGIDLASTPEGPIVQVWDNGPGIPEAERGAVLRRFYRVDRSRHLPGTGLGLSLVAAIVRLHSFSLAVDERPDGGCRATLLCSLSSVEA